MQEESDEAELVALAVGGDKRALGTLIAMHDRRLQKFIDMKMTPQLHASVSVEDILQDCYMSAYLAIGGFQPKGPGAFWGWLKTIAYNKLRDAGRKRSRQKVANQPSKLNTQDTGDSVAKGPISLLADSYKGPTSDAMTQELRDAFRVAVAGLSEKYRQVIVLHYLQNLPKSEVAERLGTTEGAVRGMLFRARREIEEEIQRLSRFI